MNIILQLRGNAKANKDWASADLIRDELKKLNIEVRDGSDEVLGKLKLIQKTMKQLPLYFVCLAFLWACSDNKPTRSVKKSVKEAVEVPDFNADSAYQYIQQQVDFGPRFVSSKGWQLCGDFLVEKLKTYTPRTRTKQPYQNLRWQIAYFEEYHCLI